MSETIELKDGESIMRIARANNEWLGVVDIFDKAPLTVTVSHLIRFKDAPFEDGRKQSGMAIVFEKGTKKMVLNSTNTRTLWTLFGDDPANVKGKEITLTVVKLKREFNGKTHGIRIKQENKA